MLLREIYEKKESQFLSVYGTKSTDTKGRERDEEPCKVRTAFQRDRDRILHSKAFRRLKHKTQVFIAPEGDHYRTRLTHTLEVAQIARTIARALSLNEDLTEAIALGHDLGHTPFGHSGEQILNTLSENGFRHNEQSVRVVKRLENKGLGLNLTWEVVDGICCHPTAMTPSTMEGKVVRLSDKIAYINHDIDDAVRGKIINSRNLPEEPLRILGNGRKERINNMITDVIYNSLEQDDVIMSPTYTQASRDLREFMFKNVYIGSRAKVQENKAKALIESLFMHYSSKWETMPYEYMKMIEQDGESIERVVCDYIAGMTDNYAINDYCRMNLPRPWDIY